MGVFHTLCNMLAIMGKRFGSAGLHDISVESGIIAEGSINSILEGQCYNRGVRLSKLIYEALVRLAWKGFYPWLEENHLEDMSHLSKTKQAVNRLHDNMSSDSLNSVLKDASCCKILDRFNEYMDYLRFNSGQFASFWISFVDMLEVFLALIRASREGNWLLHLAAIRSVIPWCFAYDRHNYSLYLSIYHSQMTRLSETHPVAHRHMLEGGFSVQLSKTNTYGKLPVDQTRRNSK